MVVKTNSFFESLNETAKLLTQRNTLSTENRTTEPKDDETEPLILTTNSRTSRRECLRARHVLVFLGFINFLNSYTIRVNLNVAIVAMVNYTAIHHHQLWTIECPNSEGVFNSNKTTQKEGEFIWDEYTQGIILGSFYFGYLLTNLCGGILAKRFGDKRVFGWGIFLSSVLTVLTPLSLQLPIGVFIAKRIVEGLGQGGMTPAMQSLLARWVPKSQLGLTSTIVYNGAQIGTVITMPLTGILSNSDFLGGWPSAFYVFGVISCVGSIVWILIVHDFPLDHPRISKQELMEIQAENGFQNYGEKENKSIPWRQILTSFPVWAVIIAHYGNSWGFYTILIDLPTYLKNILHFDIEQNGLLSALPYLCQFTIGCLVGYTVDLIYGKNWLKLTVLRKISNSFGFYGSALCLFAVTLANCNHALAVTILALSMGFNGFTFPGFLVVGVDMAPNYAGVLMGLSNGIAQLNGFIVPYIVGSLTQGQQTLQQWKKVFYIGAAVYTFCGTVFVIFGSSVLQPWNNIGNCKNGEPTCSPSAVSSNTPEKRTSAEKNNSCSRAKSESYDDEKQSLISEGTRRSSCGERLRAQHILVLMGFFGFFNAYCLRVNLNIAIVAMVNYTVIQQGHIETTECPNPEGVFNSNATVTKEGEFIWDEYVQGIILGCFFFGYIPLNFVGGILIKKYGAKMSFGLGILISSVLTVLSPPAIKLHAGVYIIMRIIEGASQGVINPAMQVLLARWIPKSQFGLVTAFVLNGAQIGTVVAMPLTGVLCNSDFLGGWSAAFYVFGFIGCVWCIFWFFLVYDSPLDHPRISKQELMEIQEETGIQDYKHIENKPIPWRQILTSVPVWAFVLAFFGTDWGFYTVSIDLPTYLKNILHFDMTQNKDISKLSTNGLLSALPHLFQTVVSCLAGVLVDFIYQKKWFTISVLRKIANSIGFYIPALCLIIVTQANCKYSLIIIMLTLSMSFNGFAYSGYLIVGLDMAPNYAGVLMGLGNGIGNLNGFIVPYVVGILTQGQQTLQQWKKVFYIGATAYLVFGTTFVIFGSAELQPWNDIQYSNSEDSLVTSSIPPDSLEKVQFKSETVVEKASGFK
ncbi:uncharacterized protein LOC106461899 [Limulus polyphemus]|uniref:Uncharacterized protein LOC106461899 n=1 Tax=Limulus polyphemus TaxID=6850 RepID=A0ABM1SY37_LIMPO|nr:uncharacterized protein LOC106461899 [Limulus polyphemus]